MRVPKIRCQPPPPCAVQSPQETAEEAEERLCVICLVNDRDTTVLPCRHMCMCHECAQVGSCALLLACWLYLLVGLALESATCVWDVHCAQAILRAATGYH